MNILQFNVRLAEGGAAGVALDLHQRALQQGLASHFVYGYGKGGKESVSHQNYPQVIKHTPRMTAMPCVVSVWYAPSPIPPHRHTVTPCSFRKPASSP